MIPIEAAGSRGRRRFRSLLWLPAALAAALMLTAVFIKLPVVDAAPASLPSQHYPPEHGGVDLTGWDTGLKGSVLLNGEWEFYWGELLEPADFQTSSPPVPAFVQVPSPWTDYALLDGASLPHEGVATYRLRFLLPDSLAQTRQTLGIYPKSIASAYRIWINGNDKGGNGSVGTDRDSMQPDSYPKTIYFEPIEGWNEIVIQVANFSQRNAGIWQDMELGTAEAISWMRVSRVSAQVFIVGVFFVMALYYLFVYFNRRQETSALLFSLLCLSVGIRTIVLGESTALYLLPGLPWEWAVKTEYISIATTALTLIFFVNREYPKESISWAPRAAGIVLAGCILFFLLAPARIYTYYLTPFTWGVLFPVLIYTLYIYILSAVRRRKVSLLNVIGFLLFTVFALNDMLFYTGLLATDDMLSIGLFAFLLTQALNLSARFSRAMLDTERLTAQLKESNLRLERTVEERTSSLRESNAQLQEANERMADIEHFRIRLLSNISHELSTPITSIKGFAKGLRDGIITSDAPKYANRIYERSLLLERLIHDLIELTKLETNQVKFHREEVELLPFLRELFMKYEWEMEDKGIRCQVEIPDTSDGFPYFAAMLDPIRMEQVMANLISNAVRHTPPGGTISLRIHLEEIGESAWRAVISIKDTGIGIDPSMHQHIFERFGQAKQPTGSEHRGSGLGLAICKEIIHYHEGEIRVESEAGCGSEFIIHLPAIRKGSVQ